MIDFKNMYKPTSPLLIASLWGCYECGKTFNHKFLGYFNPAIESASRALFSYLCQRTFHYHRLPGTDYNLGLGTIFYYCDEGYITEDDISEACRDLENMYNHVQKHLPESPNYRNGSVKLNRCLTDYDKGRLKIHDGIKGSRDVDFYANTFTSFSHEPRMFKFGSKVILEAEIPAEEIVYYDDYVFNPEEEEYPYTKYISRVEAEVLVLTKDIRGHRLFKESQFFFLNGSIDDNLQGLSNNHLQPTDPPLKADKFFRKPCEYEDVLTKFVINRNIKKSQKTMEFITNYKLSGNKAEGE